MGVQQYQEKWGEKIACDECLHSFKISICKAMQKGQTNAMLQSYTQSTEQSVPFLILQILFRFGLQLTMRNRVGTLVFIVLGEGMISTL